MIWIGDQFCSFQYQYQECGCYFQNTTELGSEQWDQDNLKNRKNRMFPDLRHSTFKKFLLWAPAPACSHFFFSFQISKVDSASFFLFFVISVLWRDRFLEFLTLLLSLMSLLNTPITNDVGHSLMGLFVTSMSSLEKCLLK